MSDLVPTTGITELQQSLEDVGVHEGNLCHMADDVVKQMGNYNFISSNCQHFCSNLLSKLGHQTYPTTVGPETTLTDDNFIAKEFDLLSRIMHPPRLELKLLQVQSGHHILMSETFNNLYVRIL